MGFIGVIDLGCPNVPSTWYRELQGRVAVRERRCQIRGCGSAVGHTAKKGPGTGSGECGGGDRLAVGLSSPVTLVAISLAKSHVTT